MLDDGRQFRLPHPPPGEGRLGAISATLSPNGWWLGYRAMRFAGDASYEVRSLATGRVVSGAGIPVRWSADGHLLVLWDPTVGHRDSQLMILDLYTGASRPAGTPGPVAGVMPTGELVTVTNLDVNATRMNGVALRTGDGDMVAVHLAERDDDACWCPDGAAVLSPDGSRVSLELSFRDGLTPGTTAKVAPREDSDRFVVVLDRVTGAELARSTLTAPTGWPYLVADRGPDLLFTVYVSDQPTTLVALDPVSGAQHVVTTVPDGGGVHAPGMWTPQPDG